MDCVTRLSTSIFFHDLNPSRPVINRLNYFQIGFNFAEIFKFLKSSAVCIPPWSQASRCASHGRVKLCGVHHTGESNCTLRSQNRNLCESLDAFKGTNRRHPFRDEHIYHERKDLKKFFLFAKPKILSPWCHAHYEIEFFELCDQISRRN